MHGFSIPVYRVSQDENHVYIHVCATDVPAATTPNIAVEGRIFGFHLEPYYLPLVLPGAVTRPDSDADAVQIATHDGASSSSQGGSQQYRVTLNKVQQGKLFSGLEQLQPQLLPEEQLKHALADAEQSKGFFQPSGSSGVATDESSDEAARTLLQQALRSHGFTTVNDDDAEAEIGAVSLPTGGSKASSMQSASFGYGFRGQFTGGLIPAGCADTRGVLEVSDPDAVDPAQRLEAAVAYEERRWDEGMYMDNFLDIDGELSHLLRYQPNIPPRSAPSAVDSSEKGADVEALALLLQVVFAYSYDERTNEGDASVESGWTIAKLSRSLCASTLPQTSTDAGASLDTVVAATLVGCVRRALTMPLYRHWGLALACIHDTLGRLEAGSAHVDDCLGQIATRLEEGEDAVLCRLSEVWMAGLIAQAPDQQQLDLLSTAIRSVMQQGSVVTKEAVQGAEWDLDVLEQAATQALEDGDGGFV